ncbi:MULTISPECIES: 50S ribosomal protein L22 [Thalassospira]|jgi:large subunit ribosomal protein L22|uniref:Large ribosomal subunit protein uL22 n=1 Tax=Thalassospira mesophila TaxID=1293891 RepID=A0A1Y2KWS2_9PROT|nr:MULTISPECIES: 50S ribosomal protein L22 [Thalassospira]OSQ36638.1 50S ribosomal protein L22 [Thalassospira mesophila]OSQ41079.1 50S ribosomal protein L22 [Thalassospira sp. MCCC 1A01428]|tara:strand:+ start:1257 stop:1637 length:381 start_codon:yes stop_codon:yes gene_type:complete
MGKKADIRRLADNEAAASLRAVRISPRKLNLVAESIRGKKAETALAELTFSNKRISNDVKKLLESAIANAENNHQLDVDRLYVKEASVGKAFVMKRWRARARGRVGKIIKPFSNIRIVVCEREGAE